MRWTSRFDAHYSRVSDVCVQHLKILHFSLYILMCCLVFLA